MPPLRPISVASRSAFPLHSTVYRGSRIAQPLLRQRKPVAPVSARRWQSTQQTEATPLVHVRRPYFTKRRVLLWIAYAVLTYKGSQFLLFKLSDMLEDLIEEEGQDLVPPEREVDAEGKPLVGEDEDYIFFPLQLPQELPRQYYRASDPEWQEFVKLTKDKKGLAEMKQTVADKAKDLVLQNAIILAHLGDDIKLGTFWLDYIIPSQKPPTYSRTGLAILPEGVALSEQLMQHDEYNRMRRYIYPSAFFRALREGLKLYYELKKMRLKLALGLSPNDRELQIMNVIAHLEMKSKQKSGSRTGETTEATGAGGSLQRQTETQANSRMRSDKATASQDASRLLPGNFLGTLEYVPRLSPTQDISLALQTGSLSFAQLDKTAKQDKWPLGAIHVIGMVEVVGSKGRVKLNVQAAYDPRMRRQLWVRMGLIHVWAHKQPPLGGA